MTPQSHEGNQELIRRLVLSDFNSFTGGFNLIGANLTSQGHQQVPGEYNQEGEILWEDSMRQVLSRTGSQLPTDCILLQVWILGEPTEGRCFDVNQHSGIVAYVQGWNYRDYALRIDEEGFQNAKQSVEGLYLGFTTILKRRADIVRRDKHTRSIFDGEQDAWIQYVPSDYVRKSKLDIDESNPTEVASVLDDMASTTQKEGIWKYLPALGRTVRHSTHSFRIAILEELTNFEPELMRSNLRAVSLNYADEIDRLFQIDSEKLRLRLEMRSIEVSTGAFSKEGIMRGDQIAISGLTFNPSMRDAAYGLSGDELISATLFDLDNRQVHLFDQALKSLVS